MIVEVETHSLHGRSTALGIAGTHSVVIDRSVEAGGGGLGFSGGQLLYVAVAACVSNSLFREAKTEGIDLNRVKISVRGEFAGDPPVCGEVGYEVEVAGNATQEELQALIVRVDKIAPVANSLRNGISVRLTGTTLDLERQAA